MNEYGKALIECMTSTNTHSSIHVVINSYNVCHMKTLKKCQAFGERGAEKAMNEE